MSEVTQPTMTDVTSSNIASVGFDADAERLWVKFTNGGLYYYDKVSAEVHAAFIGAESLGKHLIAHIKGKFDFVKVS